MRIGIVKTSSMGDVIHALPVLSDLRSAMPDAVIDWVVESGFAEIPGWHPSVNEIIPISIRRWRKSLGSKSTWAEIRALRLRLRNQQAYDVVLDLQGLYKSALVALAIKGETSGYSFRCAREPLATLTYSRRFDVDMKAHAIERMRQLAAQVFAYVPQGLPRFNLSIPAAGSEGASLSDYAQSPFAASAYAVMLHASARAEKLWQPEQWRMLISQLNRLGLAVVLPWASAHEHEQAQKLASTSKLSWIPPAMTLTQCARLLGGAQCVVGVDTGLTHLAAALGTPTISLFGATAADRYGPYWSERAINLGDVGSWPVCAEVLDVLAPWLPVSAGSR